jgi:hypothetical protein
VKTEVLRSGRPVETRRVSNPYHAVAITPGAECCEAARKLQEQRFLSTEAPPIPLPSCDFASCTCRYAHFQDRRARHDRRRSDAWNVSTAARRATERRSSEGRRITDH